MCAFVPDVDEAFGSVRAAERQQGAAPVLPTSGRRPNVKRGDCASGLSS